MVSSDNINFVAVWLLFCVDTNLESGAGLHITNFKVTKDRYKMYYVLCIMYYVLCIMYYV